MTARRHSQHLGFRRGRSGGMGVPPMRGRGILPLQVRSFTAGTAVTHTGKMPVLRWGFSLAELMIAIGILGIGMTMAATLFPTAIKLNEMSTQETIGTIICENGLAIAQTFLRAGNVTDPNLVVLADADAAHTTLISAAHQCYPDGATISRQGFVVLGRQVQMPNAPPPVHQLVIVSYDKKTTQAVTAEQVTISDKSTSGGVTKVTLSPTFYADKIGSPLIVAKNASFARIIDYNSGTKKCYLDHDIDANPTDKAFVIVEGGVANSPAMTVLVANTALNPNP